MFAKWEWAIIELIVLAALVAELISVRRSIRRDRAAKHSDISGGDDDR